MKRAFPAALVSAFVLLAAAPGIRPRAGADSYPAHQEREDLSIGAALIPPEQVRKMFAADLNHVGYLVIEIGVFPAPGKDVDLFPHDFTLSAGDKNVAIRPVDGDTIAEILAGKQEPPQVRGPLGVNTSTGISVGHGTYTDPVTGRRINSTTTTTDTGVGIGGPAPQPCPAGYGCDPAPAPPPRRSPTQTANALGQELWEKSLPDGKTAQPVAGYLYFPKPRRQAKGAVWELRYETSWDTIKLPLSR